MTPALPNRMTILLADDDPDDCLLVRDALVAGGVVGSLRTVGDGEELLNYLNRRGTFSAEGRRLVPASSCSISPCRRRMACERLPRSRPIPPSDKSRSSS